MDAATTRSMTACVGQRCPPSPTPFAVIPHSSPLIMGNHKGCPYTPQDSGRTQTSSFRAQSRNPCSPALQLGCCDYAQHDGVCRATAAPHHPHHSPSFLTPHPSSWATTRVHPSKTGRTTVAESSNIDCDYAQHDGVCRATLPPSPTAFAVIPHSSPLIMGNHKGCPYTPQRQRQNPNFVIPCAVAESMFPCTPT